MFTTLCDVLLIRCARLFIHKIAALIESYTCNVKLCVATIDALVVSGVRARARVTSANQHKQTHTQHRATTTNSTTTTTTTTTGRAGYFVCFHAAAAADDSL